MESTYIPGVSDRLQDQLCSAYVAFAEHGDPNNELLPQWDAVTEGRIPTMVLEEQPWVGINHDQELQLLLQPWFQ
jgi:para-nitrobenzyl esterase